MKFLVMMYVKRKLYNFINFDYQESDLCIGKELNILPPFLLCIDFSKQVMCVMCLCARMHARSECLYRTTI